MQEVYESVQTMRSGGRYLSPDLVVDGVGKVHLPALQGLCLGIFVLPAILALNLAGVLVLDA